jgi:hypothetical protein
MVKLGYVIASKKITGENKKIAWMYREEPSDPQDSGWRFFSGEEDQEYANNPENFEIYDIHTILKIDDSIQEHLLSNYGSSFEKNNAGFFIKIED